MGQSTEAERNPSVSQSPVLPADMLDPGRDRRRSIVHRLVQFAVVAGLFVVWELAVRMGLASPLMISTPARVARYLVETVPTGDFLVDLRATAVASVSGFLLGAVTGILSGVLLARVSWLDDLLDPILTFLNALPRIALAPLFLLWFGIGLTSKTVLAASLIYFIMLTSTRGAVRSIDPQLVMTARLLSASPMHVVKTVVLPGSVPGVFGGIRLSVVYSLLGVIAAEMIASRQGLGQLLTFHSATFNTAGVIGILIVLGNIGVALNATMSWIEKRLLAWQVA